MAGLQDQFSKTVTRELLVLRTARDKQANTIKDLRAELRALTARMDQVIVNAAAPVAVPGNDPYGHPEILVAQVIEPVAGRSDIYYATRKRLTGFHTFVNDEDTEWIKVAAIDGAALTTGEFYYVMFGGLNPVPAGGDEAIEPIYHVISGQSASTPPIYIAQVCEKEVYMQGGVPIEFVTANIMQTSPTGATQPPTFSTPTFIRMYPPGQLYKVGSYILALKVQFPGEPAGEQTLWIGMAFIKAWSWTDSQYWLEPDCEVEECGEDVPPDDVPTWPEGDCWP